MLSTSNSRRISEIRSLGIKSGTFSKFWLAFLPFPSRCRILKDSFVEGFFTAALFSVSLSEKKTKDCRSTCLVLSNKCLIKIHQIQVILFNEILQWNNSHGTLRLESHGINWKYSLHKKIFSIEDFFSKCGTLRDLVPILQFKKREKHPWRRVNFSKVAHFRGKSASNPRKTSFFAQWFL